MTIDYTRLRELAEAAKASPDRRVDQWATTLDDFRDAANPAVVLGLLDRIAELEAGETSAQWRVVSTNGDWADAPCRDKDEALEDLARYRDGYARLERRTVTTGAWEVAE